MSNSDGHRSTFRSELPAGHCDVAVIVPACNEESQLTATLDALLDQTRRPDRIVVVANNCTDQTLPIARAHAERHQQQLPIDVLDMPHNTGKKASALNLGLTRLLATAPPSNAYPRLGDATRYVVTIDADTVLDQHFVERAVRILDADTTLGGLSAACRGKTGIGETRWQRLISLFQRIEYGRFAIMRVRTNVHTMSGAGSVYRAEAMDIQLDQRGYVFDPRSLVEDYALTLDLKESDWKVTTNQHCVAYTDLMPTLQALLGQRRRWTLGTITELRARGVTRHTAQSVGALAFGLIGIAYMAVWGTASASVALRFGLHPDWSIAMWTGFWLCYQVYSVKHLGWKIMVFEALVLPELAFGLVRNYWLVTSLATSYSHSLAAATRRTLQLPQRSITEVWT